MPSGIAPYDLEPLGGTWLRPLGRAAVRRTALKHRFGAQRPEVGEALVDRIASANCRIGRPPGNFQKVADCLVERRLGGLHGNGSGVGWVVAGASTREHFTPLRLGVETDQAIHSRRCRA